MSDTYDRRRQLGASRRRLEDAVMLHMQQRWTGATYLSGYAVECALKSLICHEQCKDNFKDTAAFQKKGLQGASLHSLVKLLDQSPALKRAIQTDRTNTFKTAWNLVSSDWRNDELRYSDKVGHESDSTQFIEAVKKLHNWILSKQGEAS